MAKFIDLTLLAQFGTELVAKINNLFVKKESGKGLSTNDYTTAEKNKLSGLSNYSHPASGVTVGTYRSVAVDANGHVTAGTNPTTLDGYGITAVEASKITGTIDIARLPKGALERLTVVASDTARFALTTADVQVGDTVKVTATGQMYYVKDDSKLSTADGYEVYAVGAAASVPWSGITDKPTTFTPATHTHTLSQISDYSLATSEEITALVNGLFV